MKVFSVILLLMSSPVPASEPNDHLSAGDERFRSIDYPAAIEKYEAALAESPQSADVLWRLARVYVCLGDAESGDSAVACYRKAESYARDCIARNERKSEGHTWLAAALGNLSRFGGSKAKIDMAKELKSELDRALALNPKDDVAYSVLGSFYRAIGKVSWIERRLAGAFLASLPEGGYEEAEAAFQKAIQFAPKAVRHRYELGMLYLDQKRNADAKAQFESAQSLSPQLASDRQRLSHIKSLLAYLNK